MRRRRSSEPRRSPRLRPGQGRPGWPRSGRILISRPRAAASKARFLSAVVTRASSSAAALALAPISSIAGCSTGVPRRVARIGGSLRRRNILPHVVDEGAVRPGERPDLRQTRRPDLGQLHQYPPTPGRLIGSQRYLPRRASAEGTKRNFVPSPKARPDLGVLRSRERRSALEVGSPVTVPVFGVEAAGVDSRVGVVLIR